MTSKAQLQSKISELETELQSFKKQLSSYKDFPTIQEASVGDTLEDGSIVLSKENGIAILVAPEETEVRCGWSKEFPEVFESLKDHGFNPSQWFVPDQDLLKLAWKTIPDHFASTYYWSSTEINATDACILFFSNGNIGATSKANSLCVRAFRCVTY
jgi:hypothetical protein